MCIDNNCRFEEKFRYDEHGLPRVWKPTDDIDSYFRRARDDVSTMHLSHSRPHTNILQSQQAITLIPLFAKIDLKDDEDFEIESDEDFDFKHSLTVLTEAKQIDITNRFKRESDAFYLEAKRSIVATTAKIPSWLLVVMIALGWNEFMTIIKSPLYLVLFALCITFGYVIYALNLWGPLERILSTVFGEATKMAKERVFDSMDRMREQQQQSSSQQRDTVEMKAFNKDE